MIREKEELTHDPRRRRYLFINLLVSRLGEFLTKLYPALLSAFLDFGARFSRTMKSLSRGPPFVVMDPTIGPHFEQVEDHELDPL